MKIGLGQINAVVGDLAGNVSRMVDCYNRAVEADVDLLIFPELATCGYPPEDLLSKKEFVEDNRASVEKLAADCPETRIIAGFPESYKGSLYNSAAVLEAGKIKEVYRKRLLAHYSVSDERKYFKAGSKPVLIEVGGLKIALTICYDILEIARLKEFLKEVGPFEVLVNISASAFHLGKTEARKKSIINCVKEFNSTVAYCNLVGGQDELVFDGRSILADSSGKIAATAAAFREDLLIADIISTEDGVKVKPVDSAREEPSGPVDEVYQALVLGVRDYVRKNGFEKVLLGLSGGIDSSVSVCIAAAGLGARKVIGITMPSRFNSSETIADANQLAENLGIEFLTIPIDDILEASDNSLAVFEGWDKESIAFENLQARIRGNILMSLSNSMGGLVLTSGNKSESAVGYATLYGDTAGGFSPLKDVPKTLVYKLAEHINAKSGSQLIPESVIRRAPSAELSFNQKDTDSLPDYSLLDRILQGYVEENKSAKELIAEGIDAEVVRKVIRMVDANEYKRRQSPPGVKITPRALGRDRRLPITNRYY